MKSKIIDGVEVHFSDIDSDVDRLRKSLDRFRLLGKTMSARWALDFLCWGAALRIEGMIKEVVNNGSAPTNMPNTLRLSIITNNAWYGT